MAASILGKRSRRVIDAEDVELQLPRSKRQTRRAPLSIFEDKHDERPLPVAPTRDARAKSKEAAVRATRSGRRRNAQLKAVTIAEESDSELVTSQESTDSLLDIENIAPTELNTPVTTRFKDCLGIRDSCTPKHRVRLAGTTLTPKPSTKAHLFPRAQNIFSTARQLFAQSSAPVHLIGRDVEKQQIRKFISQAIQSRTGGCTYVSGPPGTGKSAFVQEVFREFDENEAVQTSIINCVSLKTADEVFSKLSRDFSPNTTIGKSSLKQSLSKLFLSNSRDGLRLILLDEIDNLLDGDCDVLYTLFEWAMHKSSSIILVGIANALDLTDRFLPRLKARGLKPNLLPFLPYTAFQVSAVISKKLRSLLPANASTPDDFVPLMQPAAIQLCGKKIASQTGDLRKAFSLVRRIIDQVEKETLAKYEMSSPSKKPLEEVSNSTRLLLTPKQSPSKFESEPLLPFSAETAPRATIAHAAKLASSIFNNSTLSRVGGLNLQQKAVLCSLVAGEKRKAERNPYITPSKSTSKVPSIKELFTKYSMLCRQDEGILQPLKDTEFRDVVDSLETLGLVHEYRGRTSSLLTPSNTPSRSGRNYDDKQIVSAVSEQEMRESLNGPGANLLQRLLDGEAMTV